MKFNYGKFFGLRHNVFAFPFGYVQFGPIGGYVWDWMGIHCLLRCPGTNISSILGRNLASNAGANCIGILGFYAGFAKNQTTLT